MKHLNYQKSTIRQMKTNIYLNIYSIYKVNLEKIYIYIFNVKTQHKYINKHNLETIM